MNVYPFPGPPVKNAVARCRAFALFLFLLFIVPHSLAAQEKPRVVPGALSISGSGREWTVMCNGARNEFPALASHLGGRIVDEQAPSLNEIFVAYAGAASLN